MGVRSEKSRYKYFSVSARKNEGIASSNSGFGDRTSFKPANAPVAFTRNA